MVRVLFQLIPTYGVYLTNLVLGRYPYTVHDMEGKRSIYYAEMLLQSTFSCLCLSVCLPLCPHYLELHVLAVTWPTSYITHFPPCRLYSPLYHSRYAMIKHMTSAIVLLYLFIVLIARLSPLIPWLNGLIPRCSGLIQRLANISMYYILGCVWIFQTSAINLRAI